VKQPKFSIGQVVFFPGREDRVGDRFQIDEILIDGKAGASYRGNLQGQWVHESHLGLYQEPQKKKLKFYGFRVRGLDEILYASRPNLDDPDEMLIRCTGWDQEYDIEYPDANV